MCNLLSASDCHPCTSAWSGLKLDFYQIRVFIVVIKLRGDVNHASFHAIIFKGSFASKTHYHRAALPCSWHYEITPKRFRLRTDSSGKSREVELSRSASITWSRICKFTKRASRPREIEPRIKPGSRTKLINSRIQAQCSASCILFYKGDCRSRSGADSEGTLLRGIFIEFKVPACFILISALFR